jgi:hypothetical protein
MAKSFAGMNLNNFVRSEVLKGRRLLHIRLNKIELQKV